MTTELTLLRVAIGLYLGGTVSALVGIAVRQELPRTLFPRLLGGGFAAHALSIAVRSWNAGHLAVTSFDEALSFLALVLVGVFLLVQLRRPLVALGAVVSPLAFGLILASDAVYRGAQPLPPVLDSAWFPVHVVLSVLGDAVFALAFSASLLYLVQERRLKAHRGRHVLRFLPSLETLDRVNYRCLVWGLILLTLGIVSGIVWAHTAWGRFWSSDPKLVFSLVTWAIYVVLLQGRMTAGWRGRWAATLTIAGFAVIVLSLVGVNVLALGNHGRAF
jgi:cytochrome c-type biogenesis protein CcsB